MRRSSLLVSVLAVVPLGLLAVSRAGPSAAQDATPAVEGHGFVGSWRMEVRPPQGPPFLALATFGVDGTLLTSGSPVVQPPGPGGVVFLCAGHGAWEATGSDAAIFTFADLQADGQGNPDGTGIVRAAVTLEPDGQAFRGEYVRTFADSAGNVVATIPGTVQATRIVAEAPARPPTGTPPAATPAA